MDSRHPLIAVAEALRNNAYIPANADGICNENIKVSYDSDAVGVLKKQGCLGMLCGQPRDFVAVLHIDKDELCGSFAKGLKSYQERDQAAYQNALKNKTAQGEPWVLYVYGSKEVNLLEKIVRSVAVEYNSFFVCVLLVNCLRKSMFVHLK